MTLSGEKKSSSRYCHREGISHASYCSILQTNGGELLYKTYEHITISLIAVILGVLVAVPLGIVLTRMKKGAGTIIGIVNIIQTLPSLAILAFFIPLLGVGKVPAIVALFFYSVLPILRNTYTGIRGINKICSSLAKASE